MTDNEFQAESWQVKYRPKNLKSVVGQTQIVNQIRGMIKSRNVDSCILITGATGTGKTSLARIIAYTINQVEYGYPCQDIQEFNMSEEGGIDNVKRIIQSSKYKPSHNFRVFILDEMQRISQAAASALLKPLEEASIKDTVWLLVTNEPEKLLSTIRGRATPFTLEPIEPKDLVPRLKYICEKEKVKFLNDKLLLKIAQNANGQPRAAIGLLKSVVNAYFGSEQKDAKLALQEILASSFYNNASIAFEILSCLYLSKGKQLVRVLQQVKNNEYITLTTYLLEHNNFVLDQKLEIYTWLNEDRKKFLSLVDITNVSFEKVFYIHKSLVDIKTKLMGFNVPEKHLMLAELSFLIIKMRSKNE